MWPIGDFLRLDHARRTHIRDAIFSSPMIHSSARCTRTTVVLASPFFHAAKS